MTDNWQIIWESNFKIIDESELKKMKTQWELKLDNNLDIDNKWWNLRDDLIKLWFLDYDNLNEEEKKIFDEMKDETRDDFYELD
jgi:hypothetical protein